MQLCFTFKGSSTIAIATNESDVPNVIYVIFVLLIDLTSSIDMTDRPPRTHVDRYLGITICLASSTCFVLMDLFAQYLLVIDPIDPVSVMFLRMTPSLVFSYAYLYHKGAVNLPFGPREYRTLAAVRSAGMWLALQIFFIAVRHIR